MLACGVSSAASSFCPPTSSPCPPARHSCRRSAAPCSSGELIAGFPSGDPLDLARATIYVPTQRAAAALARELVAASGKPSLILPRIAPLGAFEPTVDPGDLSAPGDSAFAERPAVGELARRMTLARMTRAWGEALRGAIRSVGPTGSLKFDESERAAGRREPGAGVRARRRSRGADRRHDHRGRRPGSASPTSSPTRSTPIGASPSTSSRSPSRPGRNGSTSSGLDRPRRDARGASPSRSRSRNVAARSRGPVDHRRLDRRQPRHRPPHRRDRARAATAPSCCPISTSTSTRPRSRSLGARRRRGGADRAGIRRRCLSRLIGLDRRRARAR